MTEMEWTNDQVLALVNEYKNRPMLWDPNHDMYRVQTAKYEAWCELAEMFECEISDLRKKFNSIFASHRREKSKVRMGGRSNWFLYNHLSFLPNHIGNEELNVSVSTVKKRKKKEVPEEQESELSAEEYEDDCNESPEHIIVKEELDIKRTPPKRKFFCSRPRLTRRIKRGIVKDRTESLAESNKLLVRKLYKCPETCKKKDECDTFGEYIAMSLRKHDERTRSMIKQAINNILFEQEMKKYNSGQYAVIISNVEENPLIVGDECEK